jgi:hypothetical protein
MWVSYRVFKSLYKQTVAQKKVEFNHFVAKYLESEIPLSLCYFANHVHHAGLNFNDLHFVFLCVGTHTYANENTQPVFWMNGQKEREYGAYYHPTVG